MYFSEKRCKEDNESKNEMIKVALKAINKTKKKMPNAAKWMAETKEDLQYDFIVKWE